MNIATSESIANGVIISVNRGKTDVTDRIKRQCLELMDFYDGNIKIEIDIHKKWKQCKVRVTEFDI